MYLFYDELSVHLKLVRGIWRHQLQPHHKMLGNLLARMCRVRQVGAAAAAADSCGTFATFRKVKLHWTAFNLCDLFGLDLRRLWPQLLLLLLVFIFEPGR